MSDRFDEWGSKLDYSLIGRSIQEQRDTLADALRKAYAEGRRSRGRRKGADDAELKSRGAGGAGDGALRGGLAVEP